ncbi:MAG: hypothetical protein NHB15_10730 [Methanosarcina barkeri]|nr:hypothetical protein [Methanosarcina sp. ERenArc_MAG2]
MPENQQIQKSKKPDTTFQKQATPVIQTPVSNPYSIIQRAKINPKSLTHADIMQLQRTIGNQAVGRLLSSIGNTSTDQQMPVQRQEIPEEEEPLQGKIAETIQRQEISEEDEPLQGKFERVTGSNDPVLRKVDPTTTVNGVPVNDDPSLEHEADVMGVKAVQFVPAPEEDEPLQGKFGEGWCRRLRRLRTIQGSRIT